MKIHDKYLNKYKLDYIKLLLEIIRIRNKGDDPSKEILSQARELGKLTGVSEQELENL